MAMQSKDRVETLSKQSHLRTWGFVRIVPLAAVIAVFFGAVAAVPCEARVVSQPFAPGQEPAGSTPAVPNPASDKLPPDVRETLARARRAVVGSPKVASAWDALGEVCLDNKLNQCAETCYRRACELAPKNFSYIIQLGRSVSARDPRSPEVLELFREAVQLRPGNVPASWRLGKALERRGKLSEALAAFQRTTELDPKFAIGYRSAGEVLLALDRVDEAIASLERSALLASHDGGVFASLARAHRRAGNTERAEHMARLANDLDHIEDYDIVPVARVQRDPSDIMAEYGIAKSQVGGGRYEEALPGLRAYAELAPNDSEVYVYMATAHRALGQLDAAKANATKALAVQSDSLFAHLELAAACIMRDELKEGLEHYEHAKRLSPTNGRVDEWVADVFVQQGHLERAIVAYERAATLGVVRPDAHWKWGVVLAELGDLDEAINHFADATEQDPEFAHAYYSWGMALESLGRPSEAAEHYQSAVDLDPTHAAAERLKVLKKPKP